MLKRLLQTWILAGLATALGCGQSATNEPQKLDRLVAKKAAEPIRTAEQAPKPAPPAQFQPVEQATFAEAADDGPATMPTVLLTKQHEALCRVKVGDAMPAIELPKVIGGNTKLATLYGNAATVVVFWKGDRQMVLDALADLGPDVVQKFGSRGVEVVGIAVNESAADARSIVEKAAANYPQLLDADGKAFERVGSQRFPWTLVLNADGKIVWFDLEYSLATRRELQQALLATVR
jgi:peroxiredoxin